MTYSSASTQKTDRRPAVLKPASEIAGFFYANAVRAGIGRPHLATSSIMGAEQVNSMLQKAKQSAKQVELDYHFDRSQMVNSHKAHQLIQFAKTKNLGNEAEERLFKAFFTEGKSIADIETLAQLGISIGLDEMKWRQSLCSRHDHACSG